MTATAEPYPRLSFSEALLLRCIEQLYVVDDPFDQAQLVCRCQMADGFIKLLDVHARRIAPSNMRQREPHRGAASDLPLDAHFAIVGQHDLAHDVQAQASPVVLARNAEELFE